ncbi:PREDICTED: nucleolar complex protein 4 homolog [Chrysochloris asiatica]|uniref:Nucleolar complex protein 4 homolog n=1 Tax=Chrysochloris asiatica TaxID=185453 RepID=A0A9B0WZ88_CHRAS|nr:PREDICTED: nucleolar complex protein 4 homolog [Chrysochloris asiatica]
MDPDRVAAGRGRALGRLLEAVLASRAEANAVFDILAALQSEDPAEIQEAVRICSRLFGALLERGELFVGRLPPEEAVMTGSQGATRKYKVWMRHRYQSCCNRLSELLAHPSFQVQELALGTLMKFVQLEGSHPLEKPKWEGHYLFPFELFKLVVESLLSLEEDRALLLSQFQGYLEYDDIRYHTMKAAAGTVARVTDGRAEVPLPFWNNAFTLLSAVSLPRQEGTTPSLYVKHTEPSDKWKAVNLKEHRKAFQLMWLRFLQHKLPVSLYKKVLVIMHESILPQLAQPTLMMDFLTSAYDVGGAISLLALNGLFILIHKHNLEYPDFYQKLYNLLEASIFHVRYRARFFYLADLFLSSSHLPAYLVAAFAKRLSRLALTAPPEALLMVLPFICNLLRRHPACRVLIHRPQGPELDTDPYDPGEQDPAKSRALESSLWELQALQKHYHPDVSKAASAINQTLCVPEVSIAPLLELTPYEVFEQDLKKKVPEPVPLEFIPASGLLGRREDLCAHYFSLS